MGEYDSAIALAQRLIEKKGRAVSIRRDVGTTPVDAAKPWLGTQPSTSDTTTFAGFFDTRITELLARLAPGRDLERTTLEAEGTVAFVPASGLAFAIEPEMKLVDGAMVWHITRAEAIRPGADAVLYVLELRK